VYFLFSQPPAGDGEIRKVCEHKAGREMNRDCHGATRGGGSPKRHREMPGREDPDSRIFKKGN
jgi:hypothetical protein